MTVEEMKQRKKELGYSNEKLSELSGVPLGTVQKVLAGVTRSPRYETLIALERVLKKQTDRIGEALPETSEKRQGDYTVEDYYLIPKERRVELIDGVIYDMASPTAIHQILSTELCNIIRSYISQQKGRCIVMAAPMDVQLDCDDKTMVQPDVMVICGRDKITRKCIYGAPDLAVEILSDSTKKKDMYRIYIGRLKKQSFEKQKGSYRHEKKRKKMFDFITPRALPSDAVTDECIGGRCTGRQ